MSWMSNGGKYRIANQQLNWATAEIQIAPVGAGFNGTVDSVYVADVAGILGAAGDRLTVPNRSIVSDAATDRVELRCDDPSYEALDVGEVHGWLVYQEGLSDADSPIVGYWDGPDYPRQTNGGGFTIDLPGYGFRF